MTGISSPVDGIGRDNIGVSGIGARSSNRALPNSCRIPAGSALSNRTAAKEQPAAPRRNLCNQGGNVTRPRAADDFDTIYQRIKELRGETAATRPAQPSQPPRADTKPGDKERRLRDRREGLPPPWVPTIFIKTPTNSEIARRFWHIRSGWQAPLGSF
jgi:hypothetical protein